MQYVYVERARFDCMQYTHIKIQFDPKYCPKCFRFYTATSHKTTFQRCHFYQGLQWKLST